MSLVDMTKLIITTKAQTLEALKPHIQHAEVLPLIRFKAIEYRTHKKQILSQIKSAFDVNPP